MEHFFADRWFEGWTPAQRLRLACAAGGFLLLATMIRGVLQAGFADVRGAGHAGEFLAWTAYFALAVTLGVFLYRSRTVLPANYVAFAFVVSLAAEALSHMALSQSFGSFPAGVVEGLQLTTAVAAALTAIGLPTYLHGIQRVALNAASRTKTEARLLAACESTLDALYMCTSVRDAEGRIVDFEFSFINRNAERMLGVRNVQLRGERLTERYPQLVDDGRLQAFCRVAERGVPLTLEVESFLIRSLEEPAHCRMHVVRLDDGVAISVTDMTAIYLANKDLKRTLAFNKAVLLSSPLSIVVTDLTGKITMVNPAAERMLWYSAENLLGQSMAVLHDPRELGRRARELSEEFQRPVGATSEVFRVRPEMGLTDEREWSYVRKGGSRLPVQLTVSAVEDESGAVIGLMGIAYDLTERKRSEDYIYHLAHHDALTGLPSRTLLDDRLQQEIERGRRTQGLFSVLMIDLDHFKRVNDWLGHQAGDAVLVEVANRLKLCLRKVDTVARLGGDEFVVLLTELHSQDEAEAVARKILATLGKPMQVCGHDINITASIGMSMYPESRDAGELLKQADIALYRGKAIGRNDLALFTPGLGQEMMVRFRMESALRTALERNEFSLVYQPQFCLHTGDMTGVEALVRWVNPVLGQVGPDEFIPVAEETGLILDIGAWVLRKACEDVSRLRRETGRPMRLAVNLSPRQVYQAHFQAILEDVLESTGMQADCLELEITEQMLMRDSGESQSIFERLQGLGVSLAIDDFGTGFSNMAYITRYRIDRLKIDKSFIARCVDDRNSFAVTKAIVALAHSLQMEVVAEGVESEAQAAVLRGLACDYGQGYLYSRPLGLRALADFAEEAARLSLLEQEAS